jgi:hypothetical protein
MLKYQILRQNLHDYYAEHTASFFKNKAKITLYEYAAFYLPKGTDDIDDDGLLIDTVTFERLITYATIDEPKKPSFKIEDGPYEYEDNEYYMSFANAYLGGGYLGNGFVQEEILCLEFPEMSMLIANFNNVPSDDDEETIIPLDDEEYAIFTNLYRTIEIQEYGSGGFKKIKTSLARAKKQDTRFSILEKNDFVEKIKPVKVNFVAVDASNVQGRETTEDDLIYIKKKLLSAFTGLRLRGVDHLHMGKLGTGAFGHKLEDIAKIVKEVCILTGMDIIFYLYDGTGRDIVEQIFFE